MALPDGDHDDEGDGVMDGSAKRIMSGTMLAYNQCHGVFAPANTPVCLQHATSINVSIFSRMCIAYLQRMCLNASVLRIHSCLHCCECAVTIFNPFAYDCQIN